MTKKQEYNLFGQVKRNWAGYGRHGGDKVRLYTALFERGDRISTIAIANPMEAPTDGLIAVCDGELTWKEFAELLP